jgi:hypothetical protein
MENINKNPNLIHNLDGSDTKNEATFPYFIAVLAGAIVMGGILGFVLSKIIKTAPSGTSSTSGSKVTKSVGVADKKTFKDKAEGVLREGGIEGEGNFHLERSGGESQNVYLTSTTVDMSLYIGKKVRVWGETYQGLKAGWLMDVGLVEILQ